MFLVTFENNMPIGVYDYEVLCEKYPFASIDGRDWGSRSQQSKELILDGKWQTMSLTAVVLGVNGIPMLAFGLNNPPIR